MQITSLTFVIFASITVIIYYIVPKKYQWIVLLLANAVFYFSVGIKAMLFLLFTASSIFVAARLMQKILNKQNSYFESKKEITKEEKKKVKLKNQKYRKIIMIISLLLNVGILCATKYGNFVINQLNSIIHIFGGNKFVNEFNFIVPLGISFYTFQSIGYLLDVYWEKIEAESNYFKFLLFVTFFPQMTQGPISEYKQLSSELLSEHEFSYDNYSYGMWRMLWGFAKKMLVANLFGVFVNNTFTNFESYTGITTLLGAFCYSIQIYADFSGYMDIVCGLCLVLGIKLRENFDCPYFSKSIAEYWRRWHISLGDWFKNYLYYPIGMSKWSRNLAKKIKQKFGTYISNTLPATLALIIVWATTGLWHGASWGYIVWGLLNGTFIILSMWMDPLYVKIRRKLGISDTSRIYSCFQIIRTFVLVTFIKVLPEVGSLRLGLKLWKHIFTDFRIPTKISQLVAFNNIDKSLSLIGCFGVFLMFVISILKSRCKIPDLINKLPIIVRILAYTFCIMFVAVFGGFVLYRYGGGGFMYAGF